jgi:hypothetical protein
MSFLSLSAGSLWTALSAMVQVSEPTAIAAPSPSPAPQPQAIAILGVERVVGPPSPWSALESLVLPTVFELDADAIQNNPAAGLPDDWQRLYSGGLSNVDAFTGILCDRAGQGCNPEVQDKIFAGGMKDIQDLSEWSWKAASGLPDKDDITNAYAAAYTNPLAGDQILYYGADRYANSGDAFIGYWFLQQRAVPGAGGKFRDPDTGALAHHEVGDVLVIVNFPQASNASPEFNVVVWDPANADVAPNLRFVSGGVVCGDVPPDSVCSTTNANSTPSPWPYVPKSGSSGTFPFESFFEGGVRLQQLGLPQTCFSSFVCETRSSKQFTATLKDFAVGSFETCSAGCTTTCEVTGSNGNCTEIDVSYTTTVTNNGSGTFPAGSTVMVTPSSNTGVCTITGVPVVLVLANPLPPNGFVQVQGTFHASGACTPINYNTRAVITDPGGATLSDTTCSGSCECTFPGIEVTKECDGIELSVGGGSVCIMVKFKGTVTNTGSKDLVVTLTDDPTATITPSSFNLPVGGHQDYTGFYFPTTTDGGETNPALAKFTDTITAFATCGLGCTISATATAVCELCP